MKRVSLPKQTSPLKAIRAFCTECNGGSKMGEAATEIRQCVSEACPLHDFRFGKNPHHKLAGSGNSGSWGNKEE